jgi:hypothetical protein
VELAPFVTLRLPSIVLGLTSAELSKVLSCLRDYVLVQLHLDPTQLLSCITMSVVVRSITGLFGFARGNEPRDVGFIVWNVVLKR